MKSDKIDAKIKIGNSYTRPLKWIWHPDLYIYIKKLSSTDQWMIEYDHNQGIEQLTLLTKLTFDTFFDLTTYVIESMIWFIHILIPYC